VRRIPVLTRGTKQYQNDADCDVPGRDHVRRASKMEPGLRPSGRRRIEERPTELFLGGSKPALRTAAFATSIEANAVMSCQAGPPGREGTAQPSGLRQGADENPPTPAATPRGRRGRAAPRRGQPGRAGGEGEGAGARSRRDQKPQAARGPAGRVKAARGGG